MATIEIPQSSAAGHAAERPGDIASLTRRAAAGDHAAWSALVDRFSQMVWGITRKHRLDATDAADVFQTTWLRLVEHIGEVSEPRAVGAWLATTARRECLRALGRVRCQVPVGDALPELGSDAPAVDETLLRDERDATLWAAVSRLRASDQALLRILAVEPPLSYDEVAVALDMPRGSIGPTRQRCLERLRRECERQLA